MTVGRLLAGVVVGLIAVTGLVRPSGSSQSASEPPVARRSAVLERVRVGLATDLPAVTVPCCGGTLVAMSGDRQLAVQSPIVIKPLLEGAEPGAYRWQVAAFKDELQAGRLAAELGQELAEPGDAVFDAGTDLYRIRVGRYPTREAAERVLPRLRELGYGEPWLASEPGRFDAAALEVSQGDVRSRVAGRWIRIESRSENGIRVAQGRYRGHLLVYLNDRGSLNLINELSLEEYLRGVVPREMGPSVYDSLEALKAQTVAARSYTLRNLEEFSGEGYDICATPRCQVYGGMDAEHELTDRAIAETRSEVLLAGGELVDALYTSTCGGHTEDVESIFPTKSHEYLKGVSCLESGVDRLSGELRRGTPLVPGILDGLLAVSGEDARSLLEARLLALAQISGLPTPPDRLASLERVEVQRFVASVFDLALDVRLFGSREDLNYVLERSPSGWREEDRRLATYFVRSGLLADGGEAPVSAAEADELVFQLALYLRAVVEQPAIYLGTAGGRLTVKAGGELETHPLTAGLATFRGAAGSGRAGAIGLLAGDPVTLYLDRGRRLKGIAHEFDPDGVTFDRSSRRSSWTRYRTRSELAASVRLRYPTLDFVDFEVLERGVSGRVKRLRLIGADGASIEVDGLAVRWTLDLPETLFTVKRLKPRGEEPAWLFTGRGWGHGVGLCQVGAFGMGLRGHDYRSILTHYYSGVSVATLGANEAPRSAP